ncbi:hypothetical protein EON65_38100, partial [archaeon]
MDSVELARTTQDTTHDQFVPVGVTDSIDLGQRQDGLTLLVHIDNLGDRLIRGEPVGDLNDAQHQSVRISQV